jgi:hypothetical protein
MCLHDEENRIERDNDQVDLERSMFISNPEMWKELYGKDLVSEGPGVVIRNPVTEEDFEEMIREWESDGYAPAPEMG